MKKLIPLLVLLLSSVLTTHAALTWHWVSLPSDTNIQASIENAMNSAVAEFNIYSDYTGDIPVIYNSGVPTAQTDGYMGWIEFGGSISYRVAMHEMSHWLGTGTYGTWGNFNLNGSWSGVYGNNAIQSYDGPTATLGCDSQHYWPYGWNYDNEAVYPERHIGMVGALRRDMGLSDMTKGYAPGTYRLMNRQTAKMLDTDGSSTDGAQAKEYSSSGSVDQQWVFSLVSGTSYFTIQSVANGLYLDSLGNTTDGSPIGFRAGNGTTTQQWQIVQTDAGFYQIVNVASGKALDTGGQDAQGAGLQGWYSNSSWNQHWKFVHVNPAANPPGLISQLRPVTASSWLPGQQPENAVDGNSAVTQWTANGGSYPQWWRVDLGSVYVVTNVITYWYPGWTFLYRIEVSTDDVNYATAVDATANTTVGYTTNALSAAARYVRITSTGIIPSGGYASFFDCQIFGGLQTPPAPTGGLLHRYDFSIDGRDSVGTANGSLHGSATIANGSLNTSAGNGSLSGGVPQIGLQLPPSAVSGISGSFTIESWFVANYVSGGYSTLFSFSGDNTGSYVLATPARGNSPYASSISVIGGGGDTSEQQASEQYQDNGALHQMVVTYDGTTLSYYIDGALGSFMGLPPSIYDPGIVLATLTYIGVNGGSPWQDNALNGSTLDFRIYGQALTAAQVANSYTLGPDASNSVIDSNVSGQPVVPPAPTGLIATAGNNQVALNWNASSGATSYNVKRATVNGGPYTTLASPSTTSFTDTTAVNGTTYYYVVSAVDSAGESANSSQVSATPSAPPPPNAPTSLTATAQQQRGKIKLIWTQSTSANLTNNKVYRSTTSGGPYSLVTTLSPTTSYTDSGLTGGRTYYYVVTAVNANGESAYSNQASATSK